MKIKITQQTRVSVGGGQAFNSNFKKSMKPYAEVIDTNNPTRDFETLFITGATLCDREEVQKAIDEGKKIVLRVDNILEDGKNRNTGMSRLKEFAEKADKVVYQSEWAKKVLSPYAGDGDVILNGVDTKIFYPRKEKKTWKGNRYFYSKYSRNETKNFHYVIHWFREHCIDNKNDTLVLVGRYADDKLKINNPFEFHNGEQVEYKGVIQDPNQLSAIMRTCDIAMLPYLFDACSNTILEARACGLQVLASNTGGTPEILSKKTDISLDRMAKEYNKLFKSL